MTLTYKIQEAMELQRETEALQAGAPEQDIEFSRHCGIDPIDVQAFREISGRGVMIIVRCPKITARAWHGLIPPKPISVKDKSGSSGVVVTSKGDMYVSDYDLMSTWRHGAAGWCKVVISAADGASRGPYSAEGTAILKELNRRLVSRVKHGCQDDFCSPHNPGVKLGDHFAAFYDGIGEYLVSPSVCKMFYERQGLAWLYDDAGGYLLDSAKKDSDRGAAKGSSRSKTTI
jgi:hypothetical protein